MNVGRSKGSSAGRWEEIVFLVNTFLEFLLLGTSATRQLFGLRVSHRRFGDHIIAEQGFREEDSLSVSTKSSNLRGC